MQDNFEDGTYEDDALEDNIREGENDVSDEEVMEWIRWLGRPENTREVIASRQPLFVNASTSRRSSRKLNRKADMWTPRLEGQMLYGNLESNIWFWHVGRKRVMWYEDDAPGVGEQIASLLAYVRHRQFAQSGGGKIGAQSRGSTKADHIALYARDLLAQRGTDRLTLQDVKNIAALVPCEEGWVKKVFRDHDIRWK